MEYKGYKIEVSVFPDLFARTYHAVYTLNDGNVTHTVTTRGGFTEKEEAAQIAVQAAFRWVDARAT